MIRKIEFNRFTLDHWSPKLTSNARTKGSDSRSEVSEGEIFDFDSYGKYWHGIEFVIIA